MEEKKFKFSKLDTNICKGIAIMFMVFHHTVGIFYNHFDLSWYGQKCSNVVEIIIVFFSTAGKVCVPLLTLLSGYGLAKSYQKYKMTHNKKIDNMRFSLSHIAQFYSLFAFAMLFLVLIQIAISDNFACFKSVNVFISSIGDYFVLFWETATLRSNVNWFVSAIIIMYALFPVVFYLTEKLKFGAVIILFSPWIVKILVPFWNISTDSVIFYIFAFAMGIFFAQNNTFEKVKTKISNKYKIISLIFLIIAFALRILFSLPADIIFAVAIIYFEINILSELKTTNKFLAVLGKHSANIWLLHRIFIEIADNVLKTSFGINLPILVKYPLILFATFAFSVSLEKLKKIIKYNNLVLKFRKKIEA